MKKVVLILLAILMVTSLTVGFAACKTDCDKGIHDKYVASETAATCTADKVQHWACNNCDWTEDVTVEGSALGHDYTGVAWTPSATDATKHQRACTRSGCNYVDTAAHVANSDGTACKDCNKPMGTAPCQHDYTGVKWTPSTTDPTKHQRKCTKCEYVDVADHTSTTVKGTPATCTAAGREDGTKCSVCDKVLTEGAVIPALDHDYTGANWTPCSDDATKHQRTCTRSGCNYVDKASHTETIIPGTPATCTQAGNTESTVCSVCNKVIVASTTVNPLGHDYANQEWQVSQDGTTHYRECKRSGCSVRNEHNANMGAYVTTDDTNHYKQCAHPGCTVKTDVGAHNHDKLTNISAVQHSVSCSVCGKVYGDVDHVWVLNEAKSSSSTCSVAGVKVYECACGAEKRENLELLKHTMEYVVTPTTHEYKCSVCGHVSVQATAHTITKNNTDKDEHFDWCAECGYVVPNTRAPHVYGNSFVCTDCGRTPKDVIVALYYKGEYTRYNTLVEAVAAVTDSEQAVIYLGQDLQGTGIFIPQNRNINFRLQGNTYTVASGAVGSVKYESQAFHIEKNSNVTIQNGTITSIAGSGVKMLVQNYANLTLTGNLVLDGSKLDPDGSNPLYTLSNNCGTTTISNTTIIPKTSNDVAFDVWYTSAYSEGVKVVLGAGNTINGYIEYGSKVASPDWSKISLEMQTDRNSSIRFSGNVASCKDANITRNGVKFLAHSVSDDWTCNSDKHYHACTRCPAHVDEAACTKITVAGSAATCVDTGMTDGIRCSVCGHVYVKQEVIPALGHDYAGQEWLVSQDGSAHYQVCKHGCNVHNEHDADMGDFVDKDGKHVSSCGHTDCTVTVSHDADFADDDWTVVNGMHRHVCKVDGCNVVDSHVPAWGAYVTTDNTNHWRECSKCNLTTDVGAHDRDKLTSLNDEQHSVACSVCGKDHGNVNHTNTDGKCECGKLFAKFDVTDIETVLATVPSSGDTSSKKFFVIGIIESIDNESQGKMKIVGANDKYITVFGLCNIDGERYADMTEKPVAGDVIAVWGYAKNYRGEKEIDGAVLVQHKADALCTLAELMLTQLKLTLTTVDADFDLPVLAGYTVQWTSSKTDAIAIVNGAAKVTRSETDVTVTLTASLTVDGKTATKDFVVVVKNNLERVFVMQHTQTSDKEFDKANNNAILVGLEEEWFNITSNPSGNGNIAKCIANQGIRLFARRQDGNGADLTISLTKKGWYIVAVTIEAQSGSSAKLTIKVGDNEKVEKTIKDNVTIENYAVGDNVITLKNEFKSTGSSNVAININKVIIYCMPVKCDHETTTPHARVDAKCGVEGSIAYWVCDVCDKWFSDEACTTEIKDHSAVVLQALTHSFTTHPEAEYPKDTNKMIKAHKTCSRPCCEGKYFDVDTEQEVDLSTLLFDKSCDHVETQWIVNEDGTHSKQCKSCERLIPLNDNGDTKCNGDLTYEQDTDNDKHYQKCETCGYESAREAHELKAGTAVYVSGGKHMGNCVCGAELAAVNCNVVDGKCDTCGRIVGEKSANDTISFIYKNLYSDVASGSSKNISENTIDNIIITYTKNDGTQPKYYENGNNARLYNKNSLTITNSKGNKISKIVFSCDASNFTIASGSSGSLSTYASGTRTWTGEISEVSFNFSGTVKFTQIEVTYIGTANCFHDGEALVHVTNTTASCDTINADKECWYCKTCGKAFENEACTVLSNAVVNAGEGHKYGELHQAVEANCTVTEVKQAYYECSVCHKYFDETKTNELQRNDIFGTTNDNHDYHWVMNADLSHYQQCSRNDNHKTEVCAGSTNPEEFVVTSNNNGTHNLECYVCYELDLKNVACTYNDQGVCTVCGYSKFAEVTVTILIDDGLTGKVTIGANEISADTSISLEKGVAANIGSDFGATRVTLTITVDGEDFTGTQFTPTANTHEIDIIVTEDSTVMKQAFVKLTVDNKNDLLKDGAIVLIVYEAENVCFNSSLTTLDAVSNTNSVTISNNKIEFSDDLQNSAFTLGTMTDGYSIKSSTNKYIGRSANSNGIDVGDTAVLNKINVSQNGVEILGAGNAALKYNKANDQKRFRYYKSGQEAIALYVLTDVPA